jgi:hypothetical protein
MKLRVVPAVLATAILGALTAGPAIAALPDVPTPEVTGPVPATATSYSFLATDIDLAARGYVEEEFFIEGDGYRYDLSGEIDQTATKITTGGPGDDGTYPFRTRIVVRRPANPADANGAVVAEWNNVTATQDIEWNWFGDPEFMIDNGYTFVGVTAQNVGVNSLLAFDPERYAGLTVNGNGTVPTTGPGGERLDADALSYDVFSAAVKAVLGEGTGVDPLGGIDARTVIASGESQSCGRLASHYNRIEPIHEIVDAYLLTVCGSKLRTDRPEKAVRILSETENRIQRTPAEFPDTSSIRHWEVAGGSHLPRMAFENINAVLTRDFLGLTVTCEKFPLSLVQWPFTQNRAIDGLVKWANGGQAPPIAPRGEYVDPETLRRDQHGIALGGIRYPEVTVPTALNDGDNAAGQGGSVFSAFCRLLGSSTPFTGEKLSSLYYDYADYVNRYAAAADAMIADGFILPADVERLKASSRQYARLRPTAPLPVGKQPNRGAFGVTWVGTEAPDTTFQVQRGRAKTSSGWKDVTPANLDGSTATLRKEPQGTHRYRVRNTTILPGTNISEPETVVTPWSDAGTRVKVDRSGPKKPKVIVKGKRVKRGKNVFRGPVRIKVIGRADRKLPDGTAGVGLNRKSVPKPKKIRKKGRRVIKVRTRDRLGNKSKTARVVIRIKRR